MATVTRGKTYGATEVVTNTNLHQLVDSATITSIDSVDFDLTTVNPVHVGGSAPSDTNQRPWYDTTNNVFRIKDNGGTYQPVSRGQYFLNNNAGSMTAGQVVVIDLAADNAVDVTTDALDEAVFGVVLIGGATATSVLVVTEGYCPVVNVTGATANGDYLFTSTTSGKADPSAAIGVGAFGRAMSTSSSAVTAQLGGATMIAGLAAGAKFAAVEQVSATRSRGAGNGTMVVSHSLGSIPAMIDCVGADGQTSAGLSSAGTCKIKGATFAQIAQSFTDAGANSVTQYAGSIVAISDSGGSNKTVGTITAATTTNFTVTMAETGTPGGNATYYFEFVVSI